MLCFGFPSPTHCLFLFFRQLLALNESQIQRRLTIPKNGRKGPAFKLCPDSKALLDWLLPDLLLTISAWAHSSGFIINYSVWPVFNVGGLIPQMRSFDWWEIGLYIVGPGSIMFHNSFCVFNLSDGNRDLLCSNWV